MNINASHFTCSLPELLGHPQVTPISSEMYIRGIIPIGLLFAGTLWAGNAAYLYLSVSFIQMLKVSAGLVVITRPGVTFSTYVKL